MLSINQFVHRLGTDQNNLLLRWPTKYNEIHFFLILDWIQCIKISFSRFLIDLSPKKIILVAFPGLNILKFLVFFWSFHIAEAWRIICSWKVYFFLLFWTRGAILRIIGLKSLTLYRLLFNFSLWPGDDPDLHFFLYNINKNKNFSQYFVS